MVKEVWLPVPGYETYYEVSNFGSVRSLDRAVPWKKSRKTLPGRVLKIYKDLGTKTTYHRVVISKNGRTRLIKISRLVLSAFRGLDLDNSKIFACHIDDNGENNRLDNLFIGTPKENTRDAIQKGRYNNSGSRNGNSKLKEEQVSEIKKLIISGVKLSEIAKVFHISPVTISDIKSGNRWKLVK